MTTSTISPRLAEEISTYCNGMNEITISDLGADVADGALDWLPDEFAAAILSGEIQPAEWRRLTDTGLDDDDYATLDADLRLIWSHVAPQRPYPLDV
jgi:hypothetical protein